MFLIHMSSQIVNLKLIRDDLVLKKCYQCGGETLGPVVKHSVRDSRACSTTNFDRDFTELPNILTALPSMPYCPSADNLAIMR